MYFSDRDIKICGNNIIWLDFFFFFPEQGPKQAAKQLSF